MHRIRFWSKKNLDDTRIYSNAATYIFPCIKSLFRAIIFHTLLRVLYFLSEGFAVFDGSRRNWVTRNAQCNLVVSVYFKWETGRWISNTRNLSAFFKIIYFYTYLLYLRRQRIWRWMKRSWKCCIITFISLISRCISQLSTLLTYAPIEFRSLLFHLHDFSLSSAHRDVVLSQKRCNIIPKNTVIAAIPFFNYLSSSIPSLDRVICRINK